MAYHPIDPILVPLGFEVKKFCHTTRCYQVIYKGRRIRVELRERFYRGPAYLVIELLGVDTQFSIYVAAPDLKTYAMFGKRVAWRRWGRGHLGNELELDNPDYEDWAFTSDAPDWANDLLVNPTAKPLILRLGEAIRPISDDPVLMIKPGYLVLKGGVARYKVTTDYVRQRMDDLLSLADIVEALPPIDDELERVYADMYTPSDRKFHFYCCLITIFLGVVFGLVSWLIFSLIDWLF